MYAPTTEVVDAAGQRVILAHVTKGRALLGRKGDRLKRTVVRATGATPGRLAVTLVTANGRRLSVEGAQRILVRGKAGKPCWRPAKEITVRTLLFALADGILVADRVTCVVVADCPRDPWITISTESSNLFAEEILCRAN